MPSETDLRRLLSRIDGRGYRAYRDLEGRYALDGLTLYVDRTQGDPFAAPSKLRARVDAGVAGIPEDLFRSRVRRIALEDFLARAVRDAIHRVAKGRRGTGKSGLIAVDAGGPEVLERTAIVVTPRYVEARLEAGLPAAGRSVLGHQAEEMLCGEIPEIARRALHWQQLPQREAQRFVACVENQEHIRAQLDERGLVAFVADGSILPRASGVSQRPLAREEAVPFRTPESLRVSFRLPNPLEPTPGDDGHRDPAGGARDAGDEHCGPAGRARDTETREARGESREPAGEAADVTDAAHEISGMGIPRGVTLIVGGGYHGKSTLLRALERGVYPHVPGDGREYVVTAPDAVTIRAEDGRRVERTDISAFIRDLPRGRSTTAFSSEDASGSTSQAANIVEAIEAGASLLLLDEDTSATNFMVRDARMQALVPREGEPITPFVDRVREIADRFGVSTVLVMGGCGDYLEVADTVIRMADYEPFDATEEARRVAAGHPTGRAAERPAPFERVAPRIPLARSFDPSRGRRDVKIDVPDRQQIRFGTESIDLRAAAQLVDPSQTRAAGHAIHLAASRFMDGKATLAEVIATVDRCLEEEGLGVLDPFRRGDRHPGNLARPRPLEIAAAINRLRTLRMRQRRDGDG